MNTKKILITTLQDSARGNSLVDWGPSFTLKMRDPVSVIRFALNLAIVSVIIVAVFMLIFSGFKFAISGGKQDKIDEAKRGMLYAVLGIVVAVSAYVIVAVLFKFLTGVSIEEAFRFI